MVHAVWNPLEWDKNQKILIEKFRTLFSFEPEGGYVLRCILKKRRIDLQKIKELRLQKKWMGKPYDVAVNLVWC